MDEYFDLKANRKHLKLRIILLILALLVAMTCFAIVIREIIKKEPGFYTLETDFKYETRYNDDYVFEYYLDGDSDEIRVKLNNINDLYSNTLEEACASLDEINLSSGYASLALINQNLDTDIVVTDFLYNTLKDAYNKTILEGSNYSIFAEPIYDFWDAEFTRVDDTAKNEYDPKYNKENEKLLLEITNMVNDLNNFSLSFNDTNNTIRLSISDEYKAFREKYEIDGAIISVNVLKDAYIIKYLEDTFRTNNLLDGYIYSKDQTILVNLSSREINYPLYDLDTDLVYYGYLNYTEEVSIMSYRYFKSTDETYNPYYELDEDTRRTLHIDISTGYPCNDYLSTTLVGENIIELAYLNNHLCANQEIDDSVAYAIIKPNTNHIVYINGVTDHLITDYDISKIE